MGTPVACTFANLFLAVFEENYVYSAKNAFLKHIRLFLRYVDDVFLVWDGTEEEFEDFVSHLNTTNQMGMSFTSVFGGSRLEFLDVLVTIEEGDICTSVYRKPTATNSILHFNSFHPKHVKRSLPYSQLLRTRRVNNTQRGFTRQAGELRQRLMERGYPKTLLDTAMERVSSTTDECNRSRQSPVEPRFTFCFKYGPLDQEIRASLRRHWHVLERDRDLTGKASGGPLISNRRSTRIRDILVRNRLVGTQNNWLEKSTLKGNYRCGHCHFCARHVIGRRMNIGPITHTISQFISCKTDYVVYVVFCPCRRFYIGKTIRQMYVRFREHVRSIQTGKGVPRLINHVREIHEGNADVLTFAGIERVVLPAGGGDLHKLLLRAEARWIMRTNATGPAGFNDRIDMAVFL
ncbi:uncharacterized protein LOC143773549 [Ranitomeya variabilis]|uniref:uncharacterized protein LOC143773549 n=1 Tax=Ranitomeya variabilis TaxID=490064 RepID=UPI004057AA43